MNMPALKPLPLGGTVPSTTTTTSPPNGTSDLATGSSTLASYPQPPQQQHNSSPPGNPLPPVVSNGISYQADGSSALPTATRPSATAAPTMPTNASDLLLSFLSQTVREMKEKIHNLEEDNGRLRAKHRKLKRRFKENDERVDQLFSTVTNLVPPAHPPQPRGSAATAYLGSGSSLSSSASLSMQPTATAYSPFDTHAGRARPPLQTHLQPLQDFLDRAAPAMMNDPSSSSSSAASVYNNHPTTTTTATSTMLRAAAGARSTSVLQAQYQQQQQQQQQQYIQQQQRHYASAAATAVASPLVPPLLEQGLAAGFSLPSYKIETIDDIHRHFPFLEVCYFDKAPFVINDLRMPFLVMQFEQMESTVVTASEAYCSLSGFTLHEVCHTKKLVALLPREDKKKMIPLFMNTNEPYTAAILATSGRVLRKDGQIVRLAYQMQFFFDTQGKVKWLVAAIEKMVGVDKSLLYSNFDAFQQNDEERIKVVRDRLFEQEKQEWSELIYEFFRATSTLAIASTCPPQLAPPTSSSPSPPSSSSSLPSASIQQDLPSTSPPTTASASSSASSSLSSVSSSSTGGNSPPASPLSPMTTSWLAEMLATPPTAASSPYPGRLEYG